MKFQNCLLLIFTIIMIFEIQRVQLAVLFPPSGFEPTANASVCYRIFELFLHCSKSVGNWMMLLF
ncbi:unnamed protein product [Schistosoma rodhaini]|nr:unnamed protein product [Schistosoma rodhaini]